MIAATAESHQQQQEEVQQELEAIIRKVSPLLSEDEVSMLCWGCSITLKRNWKHEDKRTIDKQVLETV